MPGGVSVSAAAAATVYVYNAAGQCVKSQPVGEGVTEISLQAGFCIVRVGSVATKVVVR